MKTKKVEFTIETPKESDKVVKEWLNDCDHNKLRQSLIDNKIIGKNFPEKDYDKEILHKLALSSFKNYEVLQTLIRWKYGDYGYVWSRVGEWPELYSYYVKITSKELKTKLKYISWMFDTRLYSSVKVEMQSNGKVNIYFSTPKTYNFPKLELLGIEYDEKFLKFGNVIEYLNENELKIKNETPSNIYKILKELENLKVFSILKCEDVVEENENGKDKKTKK